MTRNNEKNNVWMTTRRIETLVDGIFAIAMTLIVLSIDLPVINGQVTDPVIWQYISNLSQQLFIYAFSFILLASFWKAHHQQFFFIKRFDSNLIWLNVIWLMFIALVPFSTNFVSTYGSHLPAMLFFNLNMLFIGIFYILNWTYVYRKKYFIKEITVEQLNIMRRMNLVLPITASIAIGITFISPSLSPFCYFLIFILKRSFRRRLI